jgi:predicted Zn-dependent protease
LVALLAPYLNFVAVAHAQQESKEEKKLRERQEELKRKEEERKEKEEKARSREIKKYNTLREFAEDQYATDVGFRDEVDGAYLDLQSQHALDAYKINVQRQGEVALAETEDQHFRMRRVLYDNPWVQDYVNRIGQKLVPEESDKLYAFKVTYHPIPYAYTLSTGTILISTGMISVLDSEAQLAYVLAHELGHVHKNHWKVKIMMPLAEEEYNKRQQVKRAIWAGIFGAAGAIIGGAAKGKDGAVVGLLAGATAGYVIGTFYNQRIALDWDDAQENEADDFAVRAVVERFYDVQEVPKLYTAMQQISRFDERMQLGFLGLRTRLRDRKEHCEKVLQGPLQAKYQELLKAGKLMGTTPEYNLIMAELKRDNGIEAYRFDMFEMAKRNLQQAVSLRSDDALASYYYGRILKLVGRTKEERDQAQQYLARAISLDTRQTIPEIQLQRALMLMDSKEPATQTQALQALKDYIVSFQKRQVEGVRQDDSLPPNVSVLYDYIRLLGDKSWKAPAPELVRTSSPVQPQAGDRPRSAKPKQ